MNLDALKLAVLALIFAWSQVCCCQAWAFMAAAQGAVVQHAPLSAPAAMRCCGGDVQESAGQSTTCETSTYPQHPPCNDHNTCAGCVPRLGWVPEGPDMVAPDLIGSALPPAIFLEAPPLQEQSPAHRSGRSHSDRSQPALAPTLLRLHCALLV
jgi:hypothetical protein